MRPDIDSAGIRVVQTINLSTGVTRPQLEQAMRAAPASAAGGRSDVTREQVVAATKAMKDLCLQQILAIVRRDPA